MCLFHILIWNVLKLSLYYYEEIKTYNTIVCSLTLMNGTACHSSENQWLIGRPGETQVRALGPIDVWYIVRCMIHRSMYTLTSCWLGVHVFFYWHPFCWLWLWLLYKICCSGMQLTVLASYMYQARHGLHACIFNSICTFWVICCWCCLHKFVNNNNICF